MSLLSLPFGLFVLTCNFGNLTRNFLQKLGHVLGDGVFQLVKFEIALNFPAFLEDIELFDQPDDSFNFHSVGDDDQGVEPGFFYDFNRTSRIGLPFPFACHNPIGKNL